MGFPITKTVTLIWDGVDWRDQETGILVGGVQRLYEAIQANTDAPSQPNTHPFDKSFHVTYEQVAKMIADALYQRAAKTHMYFDQGPDQIVTVSYHRETIENISHEINQLERRITNLERPWWKLW